MIFREDESNVALKKKKKRKKANFNFLSKRIIYFFFDRKIDSKNFYLFFELFSLFTDGSIIGSKRRVNETAS